MKSFKLPDHPPERNAGEGIKLDLLLADRKIKSPGPDGITPAHIQQAGQLAINWLRKILYTILAVGELPSAWWKTKVVFIPRAWNATHTTAKDLRPMSLTSFPLKSFKRLISLHIRAIIDLTQISEAQYACTKDKSTESALHLVVSSIEKSLSIKKYTLIAFLDMKGVLNNVLSIATKKSLMELGVEPPMVGLIHQLLISKIVIVVYADNVAIIFNGKYPQTLCYPMTAK